MALIPLLVVVGPTGSGKSALALEAAVGLGGEIVSADAFAVYRGLDIGTDKPDAAARARVRHHLVDVADPRERYSAGAFVRAAEAVIAGLAARRQPAVVAGGTHFWVDALLDGLFPAPPPDPALRRRLATEWAADPDAVRARLAAVDPQAAARIAPADRQRILRALEVWEATGEPLTRHWQRQRHAARYRPLLVAPRRSRDELYARIDRRVDMMFEAGLEDEVTRLLEAGVPPHVHAFKAIGYREVVAHLRGDLDRAAAVSATKQASRRLAKRQLTWLRQRHGASIHWVPPDPVHGSGAVFELWDRHHREEGREP